MKKNILALGLAAMMLALPGCVKDTTNDLTNGSGELVKKTFTVKMELPQNEDGSRLTLDDNNAFVWEEQDEITVMGSDGKPYTATIDLAGMDGLRLDEGVTFTSTMPADVTAKYAWRNIKFEALGSDNMANFGNAGNATGDKPNASSTTGRLGMQNNNMLGATSLSELIGMLPMVGTFDADGNLFMRNIFAIAELRVKGIGRLWSAHIFSKDMAFRSAYGYVSFTSTEPVWSVYNNVQHKADGLSPKGMASTSLGGKAVASDTPLSIFFALPLDAGSGNFKTTHVHAAGSLGIVLRGDVNGPDFAISKVSTKAHRFTRNMITPISLTFNKPTTGDGATDLSANGDSNCWMVKPQSADAHYKFKALKNSGDKHTGDGYFVFPAWETPNSPVKDVWYESITSTTEDENGESVTVAETPYVHFTVKGGTQNGNTLLAMGLGSHAQHWCQEIWHIWVSDAVDQEYGGMTILDRNVGATYMPKSVADVQAMDGAKAAETCGFYYQWGRQNPFGSPKSLDGTYTTGTIYGWETGKSDKHGNTNVEVFKAMPWSASGYTSYGNAGNKNVASYKDYFMQTMACTTDATARQWAADLASPISGNDIAWKYQAKGPQDPCPQGYRVATHDELVKIFRHPNGTGSWMKYRHWDTVNKKWIYAGKYEASELTEGTEDSYAQHEYGGYHQSALTNNNFVWVPYSGIRYGNAAGLTAVSSETGALRWAGYDEDARYTNHSNNDDKGGRTYIWGVPSEANMTAASRVFYDSPSHTTDRKSDYATTAKMPFAPVMEMRNGGNLYDANRALAFNNALPVRCVKMEQADAAL